MQALLTNIELDIQELKYLMKAFEREPNGTLREVLKRNILQMRDRLDQMLTELDTVQKPVEGENIQPILTEKEIEETILEEVEEEKESRFHLLNEMSMCLNLKEEEGLKRAMETYVKKTAVIEHVFELI